MRRFLMIFSIVVLLMLSGCGCSKGSIRSTNGCCEDLNNNNVCDIAEASSTKANLKIFTNSEFGYKIAYNSDEFDLMTVGIPPTYVLMNKNSTASLVMLNPPKEAVGENLEDGAIKMAMTNIMPEATKVGKVEKLNDLVKYQDLIATSPKGDVTGRVYIFENSGTNFVFVAQMLEGKEEYGLIFDSIVKNVILK